MPIYEYKCKRCGQKFECYVWTAGARREWTLCDLCGAEAVYVPSMPNLNINFPAQLGGVHSMAGFGKRARHRQGD